jgi:hypothetical protein
MDEGPQKDAKQRNMTHEKGDSRDMGVDFQARGWHRYSDERHDCAVSPTIFRYRKYRFYFFSREETRMHVHVISPDGEAKFWLDPNIELAVNKNLSATELNELKKIVEERQNEIRQSWQRHFQS